ncbi:MAG: DUF2190 family protein [Nitrososphaerota archaeon]|nr:DUF2190 family protein [Aigarchaeota archaeon]MDW8076466.1 DUF2190 family protein [Nitrososphaerota archaeon]
MDAWPDSDVGDLVSPRDESVVLSFKAAATIAKGDPVYLVDQDTVAPATAPTNCLGIALKNASEGDYVPVCVFGVVKVVAGATINIGQAVCGADSLRRILPLTDQDVNESGTGTYTIYYARRLGIALDKFTAPGDTGRILVVK